MSHQRFTAETMSNGRTLGAESVAEIKKVMFAKIDASVLSEEHKRGAREAIENEIRALEGKPLTEVSAQTILSTAERARVMLEGLEDGLLSLAQCIDSPSHIYELGGASTALMLAQASLLSVRDTLQHFIDCKACTGHDSKAAPPAETAP